MEYLEDEQYETVENTVKNKKINIINKKSIIFITLTLILCLQSFTGIVNPFGFVMLGLASAFQIPLIAIFVPLLIGSAISGFSMSMLVNAILFFVAFTLLTAFINIEGMSKKYVVLLKLVLSFAVVRILSLFLFPAATSIIYVMYECLLIPIIYMVFLHGMSVLINIGKPYVFSSEENVALLAILAFAISSMYGWNVFGISIMNIMVVAIVLLYSWKNGAILGGVAGLIMGLAVSLTNEVSATYIVTIALSGLIAGLLSRFGKLPVILGYLAGALVVNYTISSSSYFVITILEIIIASFPIMLLPKKASVKLDQFFNYQNKLTCVPERLLGYDKNVEEKLNAVSGMLYDLSDVKMELSSQDKQETREILKKYVDSYMESNCLLCNQKKTCSNEQHVDLSIDYIAGRLEKNLPISEEMLDLECEKKSAVLADIKDIYSSIKLTRLVKKKEQDTSRKVALQYKEIANIISNLAKGLTNPVKSNDKLLKSVRSELKLLGFQVYEDDLTMSEHGIEYLFITDILTDIDRQKKEIVTTLSKTFQKNMTIKLILNTSKNEKSKIKVVSAAKYDIESSFVAMPKSSEKISGDSSFMMELSGSQYLSILSDGVGSGEQASKSSKYLLSDIEKLAKSGFDKEKMLDMITSMMRIKQDENMVASLDVLLFDLEQGELECIKLGAAPTYIVEKGKVTLISNLTFPAGIVEERGYLPIGKKISEGSVIIQLSDGVVTDEMDKKENYFTNYLSQINIEKNSKELVNELKEYVFKQNKLQLMDDTTIIVHKFKLNK